LFAPHRYIFVLRAHPVRGESHNQRNTTGEVATVVIKDNFSTLFLTSICHITCSYWSLEKVTVLFFSM